MRPGLEELDAGFGQFSPHHTRDHAAYNPRYDGEDKVKRANVLMVSRHEPAGKESRLVITDMMMSGMRLKIGVCCSGVSHILATLKIGRALGREGVCQSQIISVVARS